MFLSEIPRTLVRRWYVVLVGLLATSALIYGSIKVTPKEYTATGEVLLLPPAPNVPAGDNPYLSLSGLEAVCDILGRAMQDGEAMNAVKAAGLTSEVTFQRDQNSAAPMMLLTTVAKSPEAATRDSALFLNQIPATLKGVQAHVNVPQNAYVTSTVIVSPDKVTTSSKSQIRSILVAGVAGLVLTLLLTAGIDRWLGRHASRLLPLTARQSRRRSQPKSRRRRSRDTISPGSGYEDVDAQGNGVAPTRSDEAPNQVGGDSLAGSRR